jgi:hypothetical protein
VTPEQDPLITDVVRRVQGEFLEMPGLRLTGAQARRLWGLEETVCDALLSALVDAKFLFKTRDGAFMKAEHAAPVKALLRSKFAGAA